MHHHSLRSKYTDHLPTVRSRSLYRGSWNKKAPKQPPKAAVYGKQQRAVYHIIIQPITQADIN